MTNSQNEQVEREENGRGLVGKLAEFGRKIFGICGHVQLMVKKGSIN